MKKTYNLLTLLEVYNKIEHSGITIRTLSDLKPFDELLSDIGINIVEEKKSVFNTLFSDYITPSMHDEYVLEVEEDEDETEKSEDFIADMYYFIKMTSLKYFTAITKYEEIKSNLTDDIDELITENVTKVNDTPQNEGDFSSDNYTSNIVSVTNTADNPQKKSNLDKLIMLQQRLEDTYLLWAREIFNRFVIFERG